MTQAVDAKLPATTSGYRHHNWWLVALLVVCIPGVMIGAAYKDTLNQTLPEALPFPSTFSKKASGYSALFDLSQKLGVPTSRWMSPYRNLSKLKTSGTLFIVMPWEDLESKEIDHITNWVKEGNDLVYLDYLSFHTGHNLVEKLKLHVSAAPLAKNKELATNSSIPEVALVPTLTVSSDMGIEGGQSIVGKAKPACLTAVNYGKGRCLIGSVPDLCSNKHIADPAFKNNFQFMANWLASAKHPILFDEKCHGYSGQTNVFFVVLKSPVGFIILQLMLIALIAFISLNQRFGKARTLSTARKISNLEFIEGMSETYRRAKARDTAWAMMFIPLKAKLCKSLGVAPDAPASELAMAWSESSGKPERDCQTFLLKAQAALERRTMSEEELLDLVATGDGLTAGSRELLPARRFMGA